MSDRRFRSPYFHPASMPSREGYERFYFRYDFDFQKNRTILKKKTSEKALCTDSIDSFQPPNNLYFKLLRHHLSRTL